MQIGAFSIDMIQGGQDSRYSLAEIRCGRAHGLKHIHISNVRGGEENWLKVSARVDGHRIIGQASMRNLRINESRAEDEKRIAGKFILPADLKPGKHRLSLEFHTNDGDLQTMDIDFEVMPDSKMPSVMTEAWQLAAWISQEDGIRAAAAEACCELAEDSDEEMVFHAVYEYLAGKCLFYQPVLTRTVAGFQSISSMGYVLKHGGCCAEMSLLVASLLMARGLEPVLFHLGDHVMVGCLHGEKSEPVILSAGILEKWLDSGAMIMAEATGVCTNTAMTWKKAKSEAVRIIHEVTDGGFVLVNVTEVMREWNVRSIRDAEPEGNEETKRVCCPNCGCDDCGMQPDGEYYHCKACGNRFPVRSYQEESRQDEEGQLIPVNRDLLFRKRIDGMELISLRGRAAERMRLPDSYQGQKVTAIANKVFYGTNVTVVVLPEHLMRIGDRAFSGTRQMHKIMLPETLRQMENGAFENSGLRMVDIPSAVKQLPIMAFAGSKELASVTLHEGLEEIGERAFAGCPALKTVRIPASVKVIRKDAFDEQCEIFLKNEETQVL